jgi:hypothetical protein
MRVNTLRDDLWGWWLHLLRVREHHDVNSEVVGFQEVVGGQVAWNHLGPQLEDIVVSKPCRTATNA